MRRKICVCLFCVILSFWMIWTTVFAAGSYSSTYDMKAGVFSRDITANKYIATTVNPTQGTSDCMMGVILATKYWYGWDGPIDYISSTTGGTVTHNCSGTYKIWLRNFSGNQWTGNVYFEWD